MTQCGHEGKSLSLEDLQQDCVLVVGAPNSGKSTLYTNLTGAQSKTVNYPGSTVDTSVGELRSRFGQGLTFVDTPGTYSLDPKTLEEEVTYRVLFSDFSLPVSRVAVAVVDATQLARHLLIVRQLQRSGYFPVVALTMNDLMKRDGFEVDIKKLSGLIKAPVVAVDGLRGQGISQLVDEVRSEKLRVAALGHLPPVKFEVLAARETERLLNEDVLFAKACLSQGVKLAGGPDARTSAWDHWLLHPIYGIFFFVIIMALVFTSIFWFAAPAMDAIDGGFSWAADQVLAVGGDALWADLLANGIIASLGAVLIFLPQVILLFFFITILESTGYLARAASLADKPLSWIGLNGRSFVPLLSGYACAIPAMLAARTIPSKKERLLTLMIVPLMSCSARLPVYALLLAFLFKGEAAWKPGLSLAALYLGSVVVGALVSLVAKYFLEKGGRSFFMMELPMYRRPHWPSILRTIFNRSSAYVVNAGPMIFLFAGLMWAATTFPNYKEADQSERLSSSYAATAGKWIEPVMEPMGGDWRTGASLIAAFAAREVFVSSLAVTMHVTDDEAGEESLQNGLLAQMKEATTGTGEKLFTTASVIGLMIFFLIALQCMATFGVARKEFGGWKYALVQLIGFNILAYALAVLVVQGLRAVGVS